MQNISAMFIENLVCSLILDSGKGIEAYKSPNWNNFFQYVSPINDGQSSKPNTQGLSVWRDGKGSFSDMDVFISEQKNCFIDIKGYKSQPKLEGNKIELWAGRADRQKSKNYKWDSFTDEQVTSEIIKEYHSNKSGLQIHESLSDKNRPYVIAFTWPAIDESGKITPVMQLVNVTKLWLNASTSKNAIGKTFFQLRKKAVYNKVGKTVVSMSYVCRVEVKLKKQDAFAHLASMGAITKPFVWSDVQSNLASIM